MHTWMSFYQTRDLRVKYASVVSQQLQEVSMVTSNEDQEIGEPFENLQEAMEGAS